MAHRALPLKPLQLPRRAPPQHIPATAPVERDLEPGLRQQIVAAGNAAPEIVLGGLAEANGKSACPVVAFRAEHDHVDEVGPAGPLGGRRVVAEEAAGREDGVDGVEDEAGGGEGEVAGVVLLGGAVSRCLLAGKGRGGCFVRWLQRRCLLVGSLDLREILG